jgi:hypothetical protein
MAKYNSDIVLGDEYEDTITGMKGKATGCTFYLHACERVTLEFLHEGELKYETFDAPRLKHVESGKEIPLGERTGGPGRSARQHDPERR